MIRKKTWAGLVCVGLVGTFGAACDDGGGDDVSGSGGDAAGGDVGSGGRTSSGGALSGGNSNGGSSSGGSSSGGSGATGGVVSGGSDGGGGVAVGGAGVGGMPLPLGGEGGMGGEGMGGEGGAPPEECGGCVVLFAPLVTAGDNQLFQVNLQAGVDLSAALVTFRVKGTTLGGGEFQFFATTGASPYGGNFKGFASVSTIGEFTDFSVDFGTPGFTTDGYDATNILWIGIQVQAAATGPWGETSVILDSIRFEDDAHSDLEFVSGAEGFGASPYVSGLAGVSATWIP